jgi:protoporphyrinogen oxidase
MQTPSDKNIVFVGASMVSLLVALHYKKNLRSDAKIFFIEKADELGGLYRSFKYENDIVFDYGVHIYTETTNPVIDQLFIDILGESEWEYMSGSRRDISGTYYDNSLQLNTPFVDLRSLSEAQKQVYIDELYACSENDLNPNSYKTLKCFLIAKFGISLYEDIFKPIVVKHYRKDPSELDPMASHVIPIGRVVLHDEDVVTQLMEDERIRKRIAFPDQLSLPPCYLSPGRLIYPKKFGIHQVTDKLVSDLKSYGVEFYTSASVDSIELADGECKEISFSCDQTKYLINNIEMLYWNGGYPLLAKYLGMNQYSSKPEFIRSAFVNIYLDKPANVGELYYLYNFKPNTHIFRVVNYFNYCPDSMTKNGYAICATTWLHDYQGDPGELALKELKDLGIITDQKVIFLRVETSDRGFPNLSADYIVALDLYRNDFRSQGFKNINVIGMLAEKGHFYLTEALKYAFSLVPSYSSEVQDLVV